MKWRFWEKKTRATFSPLEQPWIFHGFQECVDGFWIWQDNQFYISSKLKARLGYDQLADKKFTNPNWWKQFVHPDDKNKLKKFLKDIISNEIKSRQIEVRIRHYHGHWVWFLVHCYVNNYSKDVPQILGTFFDVSSYRLLHDQLERTIEDLEIVSQEKSHFISHLNHEIRTPINGISGGLALLKETKLTTEQQKYLNNISSCTELLLNLVNEVLDLSKMAAGKLEIETSQIELKKVISQIISMLTPAAQQKHLFLSVEMGQNIPSYIKGDSLRLQQILINLLNNAIKFTDTGKVTLEVKLNYPHGDQKATQLLFRVIDTGHGIAKDVLPKLFQDFTQASKSVARTYGGTGLGLSICRKLVTLMGGEIGAQSTQGKGSVFWFTIPLEAIPENKIERKIDNKSSSVLKTNHILIAEDNPVNQQVLTSFLSSLGQTYSVVGNGMEAVSFFKENQDKIDYIFMDLNMPTLDGFSATKEIRKLDKEKKIPIIILTADTYLLDKENFLQNGVSKIIHKPVTKEKLIEILSVEELSMTVTSSSSNLRNDLDYQHIDKAVILTLCEDIGKDTILKLLAAYEKDSQKIIQELKGTQNSDAYNLIHTLAGMSENLGIKEVGAISRNLMTILTSKSGDPLPMISTLIKVFTQSMLELNQLRTELIDHERLNKFK